MYAASWQFDLCLDHLGSAAILWWLLSHKAYTNSTDRLRFLSYAAGKTVH